jgi:pseudaminic acid cytidylyltransferase
MSNNIAIIPARGGSKRIPRKNIKNFLGIPVIAYSIQTALESQLFDEVMVSTDDPEIADIATSYGAKVPFLRSVKNSGDFATTVEVIEEVIESYKDCNRSFESICCIYPCAPLCKSDHLIGGYHKLKFGNFNTVFPVVKYSTPIQRALKIINEEKISIIYPEYQNKRSQDLEASYFDAGQFYWIQNSKVLINKKIYTDNSGYIILNELESQDIDNILDWELAELKYKLLNNEY